MIEGYIPLERMMSHVIRHKRDEIKHTDAKAIIRRRTLRVVPELVQRPQTRWGGLSITCCEIRG